MQEVGAARTIRSWITRQGRRVKAALRRASLGLDPPPFPRNTSSYDGQASLPSGNLRFPLTFTYHGCLYAMIAAYRDRMPNGISKRALEAKPSRCSQTPAYLPNARCLEKNG